MKKKEQQRIIETLFRESRGTRCNFQELAKDTGIPASTLRRYRKQPDTMPLARALIIAKAMALTPQEAGYLITGVKAS